MAAKQISVLIARERQSASGGNIGIDIHRLVRVIAKNRPILGDRSIDSSTPTTRVHDHGDGPGLEIGPQIAPDPKRPIQSADRSPATWVAPIPTRERSSQNPIKPPSAPHTRLTPRPSNQPRN